MDVMTTAFNITTDLSQWPAFNAAIGFTRADTIRAIAECVGHAAGSPESSAILATLTRWCDGYLFASKLDASEGMYQSVMVVQLLGEVFKERDRTMAPLTSLLARWVPSLSVAAQPDRELMDYYAPSAAMSLLLPKLVSGTPLAVPTPLAALSVTQQAQATMPASSALSAHAFNTAALKALATAARDGLAPVDLTHTESILVRTLFYEGLLTYTAGQSNGLRVSNEFMQQYYVDKFAQHLAANPTLLKAAEGFILRGNTKALENALQASCAPGLIWQGVFKWLEFHCSQRLQLLLSVASQSTHFRWAMEAPKQRIRSDGSKSPRRTDVSGTHSSGMRAIHIEVKQVHLVWDLDALRIKLGGDFDEKSPAHHKALLEFAKQVRHLTFDDLLALRLHKSKELATARNVLDDAMEQARDSARGWIKSREESGIPLPQLDVYAAVAFGPLRWVIVPVSLEPTRVALADQPTAISATGNGLGCQSDI
jgi:hypothetical protein